MKKILPIIFTVALLQLAVVSDGYAAPPADGGRGGGSYYTVQYGDTLFSIGRRYGVTPYRIADVNGLRNPNFIYAGQILYIPSGNGWDDSNRCGNDCGSRCDNRCGFGRDYNYGYGYDFTGYYYDSYYPGSSYQRYSYTCGYNYNCY